jgi:uncharacterized ferritin-like protein (DUF455 family)
MSGRDDSREAASGALGQDPAREPCFVVARSESEMVEIEDFTSAASRRERLHRHMNNEIGSMEIAAQCLVDFPQAPWELQMQLARQTFDESRHVEGLYGRLRALGGYKGEFPVFNFEWRVTSVLDSIEARLAIQNRTFEAGQMDLLAGLAKMWRDGGDDETAALLESILADEVSHVRFANRWIRRLAQDDGRVLLKVARAVRFLEQANAEGYVGAAAGRKDHVTSKRLRLGTNVADRRNAEFSEQEIGEILRQAGMGALTGSVAGEQQR